MTLQSILGKNYKWWYAIKYNFKLSYEYRMNLLIALVRFFIPVLTTYLIIYFTSSNKGYSDYILIASLFYQVFAFTIGPSFDVTTDIMMSTLTRYSLYPNSYFAWLFTRVIGINLYLLLARLLLIYVSICIAGVNFSFAKIIPIAPYFLIIILIGFFIETIIGSLAFFYGRLNRNISQFYLDLMPLFSGSIFSFSVSSLLLPLSFLPTAYISHHPMQIYLGKYSQLEILQTFVGGILWCLVLFILARIVFKAGLKRNEAVGL